MPNKQKKNKFKTTRVAVIKRVRFILKRTLFMIKPFVFQQKLKFLPLLQKNKIPYLYNKRYDFVNKW
jgi:hypothetical protein